MNSITLELVGIVQSAHRATFGFCVNYTQVQKLCVIECKIQKTSTYTRFSIRSTIPLNAFSFLFNSCNMHLGHEYDWIQHECTLDPRVQGECPHQELRNEPSYDMSGYGQPLDQVWI